jgi:hypothetical protein
MHAAFVLLIVGYGTKMGLAPMHSWKPDAYGEAPGMVGTLLAGGVTSCAFLAILRVYQICRASAEAEFAREIMIFMGLLSMAVAAVFMVRQRDFKRMLAYSSVEHMGILVLGVGIGGVAVYGALLHLINNGLTKGVLFLSAGNIHRAYGSKLTDHVRGAMLRVPVSGALFFAGFIAITGAPPLRSVHQRIYDRQRRSWYAAVLGRRVVPAAVGSRVHRHGRDRAGGRPGHPSRDRSAHRIPRHLRHDGAHRPVSAHGPALGTVYPSAAGIAPAKRG